MTSRQHKIGLVGCGRWGKNILRDLKSLDCEVHVVARSSASIENARVHHADHIVSAVQELSDTLDGYIVAVPTIKHGEIIDFLVSRKKPLYTEKPFTCDEQDAAKLLEKAGDLIFVMDKWKYHNGIRKIKELINTKRYGKILKIISRRNQWGSPHTDVDSVWILAPHDISIAQYLLGSTPRAEYATGIVRGVDFISSIHAVLRTNNAMIVIEVSSDYPSNQRELVVITEKASLSLTGAYAQSILLQEHAQGEFNTLAQEIEFTGNMPLLAELQAFVKYLGGARELTSSAQEAYETVREISALRAMVFNNSKSCIA